MIGKSSLRRALAIGAVVVSMGAGEAFSGPAVTGALAVDSDPSGARVFLDGHLAGTTPFAADAVATGEHRIRVAKDGFLDHQRVVTIMPGASSSVRVVLTHGAQAATARPSGGAASALTNKWVWIGAAAAGGGVAALALSANNSAPTVGAIAVSPDGSGMAGITDFHFSADTTDPDHDALTFRWTFGDGATSTTAAPSHTFATAGTYGVSLSVSDGDHDVQAPGRQITVASPLAGTWSGAVDPVFSCPVTLALNQQGGTLSGTVSLGGECNRSVALQTGAVTPLAHPGDVTWQTASYDLVFVGTPYTGIYLSFSGRTSADGRALSGTLTEHQPSFNLAVPGTATFSK